MDIYLWEILVPTVFNDGTPVRVKYHKLWDDKVRSITGGLTIMPPTIKGEWLSPSGELFSERMIPVRIIATYRDMEQIADLTIDHYKQEAVFYYMITEHVFVKHRQ